ncbi:hypothetical protein [Streptomyces sp. NPDC059861]|uniref:hypothetical protein n=1 Tax=Streptomyces sp. NPDC059861 TaxID=3346974 RepID=UPI00365F884F
MVWVRTAASRAQREGDKSEPQQLSKAELCERAAEQDITGRFGLSREQLIDALTHPSRRRKKSAD